MKQFLLSFLRLSSYIVEFYNISWRIRQIPIYLSQKYKQIRINTGDLVKSSKPKKKETI